jgi:hypothetical protein
MGVKMDSDWRFVGTALGRKIPQKFFDFSLFLLASKKLLSDGLCILRRAS